MARVADHLAPLLQTFKTQTILARLLVTGLTDLGNTVFRWTITNAPCLEDFDEVTIQ